MRSRTSIFLITILITSAFLYGTTTSKPILAQTSKTKTELKKIEFTFTRDTTTTSFTGYVSQGYDSQKHSFTVDSTVTRIEVYLYMPSGTDFDLSVWDPNGYRTGGWTSTDKTTRTEIPNSQYSGYSANPEYVIIDPVTTTGTWYTGCYAYSGSGDYEIRVTLYIEDTGSTPAPEPPTTFTGTVSGDGTTGAHYNNPSSSAWAEHLVTLTAGTEYTVTLDWDSTSDLDLYVYKPGTAPSQDGTGSDYVTRAYTTNKPEQLTFTADVDGEWTLAVDHYSGTGTASYTLTIDIVGGGGGGGTYSWIFAVYLDADNNLDSYGVDDLNEMMQVGSTSDVGIVVMMDRASYGAKIYYVESGSTTVLEDLGEVNMGDPNTLNYFVSYIFNNYQSDHYALILWDHGGGWIGACWDDSNGGDHLTLDEIQQALSGYHLDLIGFDACLMATIETAYELRNYADVLVASEETEPGDGWPYDTILSALTQNPTMTASDLGTTIVDKYMAYYGTSGSQTMAAIDLTKVADLATALDQLAQALANGMSGGSSSSQTFTGYISQGYDSQKHAFAVDSGVVKIEVYLYMPSGTDFDLSVWDPNGYRTGGWTSTDKTTRTEIPNSQYSGYYANPEYVIIDPVTTTGTWYTGCYAYSGSGNYEIKVTLYYGGGYKSAIDSVLADVEYFADSDAADIYHFAYLVKQYVSDPTIQDYAQAVMDALVAAVIYELHGSGHPNAHGLDVYFPKTSSDYNSSYETSGLDFVADTYWDEFLNAYYSA